MPSALILRKVDGERGKVYYPLQLIDVPKPTPGPKQVLIKLNATALNHRDLFIRQDLYPGISFTAPLFADGHGTVVGKGDGCTRNLEGKSVILMPCKGWDSDPDGPEAGDAFTILGASVPNPAGMGQEYIVFDEDSVELAPEHLSAVEAAALPLVGLTGWRALVTKSRNAEKGRNILVTGIGGGVALQVLQFAVAMGCNVYVTSGDEAKIDKAKGLGAKGGVNYKSATWEQDLKKMLPDERKYIDAIIDGAGGDIVLKAIKGRGDKRLLKQGGVIVQYGMTVGPKMTWTINAVLMNVDLKGTTMGSRKEFRDMVQFVRENKITPVISRVVKGLNNMEGIEGLFRDMKDGKQFGKLVIEIDEDAGAKL